ncbi:hypothetical protein D1159_11065 [Pseudoflavonifractor sp. 524-17]|nr:hypothetical protein [Pseudoflavonifractor sp. 524-17]
MQKWNIVRRSCDRKRPLSRQGKAASFYSTRKPLITVETAHLWFRQFTIFFAKIEMIIDRSEIFSNYFSKYQARLALYLLR